MFKLRDVIEDYVSKDSGKEFDKDSLVFYETLILINSTLKTTRR